MKKLSQLVLAALFVIAGTTAKSQNLQGQTVFTLNAGYSLTGNVIKNAFSDDAFNTYTTSIKVSPVIIIGADYAISDKFSLGAAFTTQSMKGTITGYEYFNDSDELVTENFDFTLRRSHIALIPKFHFGTDNDKLDVYIGARIGYVMWKYKDDSKDPDFDELGSAINGRVTVGFTGGMRYYFTDNIGANFDLNLGAPYIVSLGLNFRIGGN